MDAETFNDLALRVLAGEASPGQRRAFEAELASQPARREEFAQLQAAHAILRTAAPLISAANATEPALPAYRQNELRTAVRQHFGPAANRGKAAASAPGWLAPLRWLVGGSGLAVVGAAVILLSFANRTVEVGLYATSQARSDETSLAPTDVPSARIVTFEQDAPFDQWQNQPLRWYEHARLWIDNEHDLLHIVRRQQHGQVVVETQPLAPTTEGQREQIKQVVAELKTP